MDRLTKEEVKHLATLCRIGLTDKDVENFRTELQDILSFFENLKDINTENVKPTSHPISIECFLRKDLMNEPFSSEDTLNNVPETKDGFIKSKIILEEN